MDLIKIINNINNNAKEKSTGRCARHVRIALQAGGVSLNGYGDNDNDGDVDAHDLLNVIKKHKEFEQISNFIGSVGTICFLVNDIKHPYGHVCLYNGYQWISDFKQRNANPYKEFSGDILYFKPIFK
jgi:hypothetical protein